MNQKLFNTVVNKSSIKLSYCNNDFVPKAQVSNISEPQVEDFDNVKLNVKTASTSSNNSHVGSNNSSRNSWTGPTLKKPICKIP
jgi:hypothetical protein